ncbi:MAG: hypothetical protein HOQ22_12985 [Nocardioidaceae bacterium]|nr:hypothetical protein [Nocardioidaceae bacterium]NUS51937.1 hypothetical protein [Nocardioidaceae bacterium]
MDVVTSSERPDLEQEAGAAFKERWPEFVFHGTAGPTYLPLVSTYFAEYDVLLLDEGTVAAGGWGVPFSWDGRFEDLPDGYEGTLARSVEDHDQGRPPTALSFMAAAVAKAYDRQGLAQQVLQALAGRARERGMTEVVAPLRPTWKHRYPLQSMADYAGWARDDGLHLDPWIRTHQRMGATILGPAARSMVVRGTVAEWEGWADMPLPVTGTYVVPDALNPLDVDRDADVAEYVEENLWVQHHL